MGDLLLKKFHKKIAIAGLLLFSVIILFKVDSCLTWGTALSLISFVTFIALVYYSIGKSDSYYTGSRLFCTTFVYSLLMVSAYLWYSWEADGDLFVFSKVDALLYSDLSMQMKDMSLAKKIGFLVERSWGTDDWGAFISMSTILGIIPHKLFLNFCYVIIGGITALFIYRTGKRLMDKQYAYIASLSYSTASFSIYYYSSFLKETLFILFVVLLINSFYKCVVNKHYTSFVYVAVYTLSLLFFRPAVAVFVWTGIGLYYVLGLKSVPAKVVMIVFILAALVVLQSSLTAMYDRYTLEGNIGAVVDSKENTALAKGTTYVLNFPAAIFGPLSTIVSEGINRNTFYGAGLLYKLFLSLPFVLAIWLSVKKKITLLVPIIVFVLIESVAAAVVQKGFEMRLTLPHIAMTFLISMWLLDKAKRDERISRVFTKLSPVFFFAVFVVVLAWNVLDRYK